MSFWTPSNKCMRDPISSPSSSLNSETSRVAEVKFVDCFWVIGVLGDGVWAWELGNAAWVHPWCERDGDDEVREGRKLKNAQGLAIYRLGQNCEILKMEGLFCNFWIGFKLENFWTGWMNPRAQSGSGQWVKWVFRVKPGSSFNWADSQGLQTGSMFFGPVQAGFVHFEPDSSLPLLDPWLLNQFPTQFRFQNKIHLIQIQVN